ncbi:hypothetical protein ACFX11_044830 [Malus domestica]
MPIAASVQGLGVHLRTAKATKYAALSQLADKETNTRTTKSRHEVLESLIFNLSIGKAKWHWLLQFILAYYLGVIVFRSYELIARHWRLMCGKWIGGMIFLLVGMFTNVLGLGPSAWRLRERLQNKFEEILLHSFRMREKGWQTIIKAGVYAFLEQLAQLYEIIVYSDYSYMHVDPVMHVMERLDTKHCVTYKLGKAATMYQIAEETYTTQTAALETAMSTPVFVQGSLNSVCNLYQLLIWAVMYTANEDLESITDTQTELQLMELDAHNFVKFKVQNSHYPNGPLQKESKFFFYP